MASSQRETMQEGCYIYFSPQGRKMPFRHLPSAVESRWPYGWTRKLLPDNYGYRVTGANPSCPNRFRRPGFVSGLSGSFADREETTVRSGTEVEDDPTVGDPEAVAPIDVHIADFLTDLRNMNTLANTIRAYRRDLTAFAEHVDGGLKAMGLDPVRAPSCPRSPTWPRRRANTSAPRSRRPARGRCATTGCRPTRWTRSAPSPCPNPYRARRQPPISSMSWTRSARAGPASRCRSIRRAGCSDRRRRPTELSNHRGRRTHQPARPLRP